MDLTLDFAAHRLFWVGRLTLDNLAVVALMDFGRWADSMVDGSSGHQADPEDVAQEIAMDIVPTDEDLLNALRECEPRLARTEADSDKDVLHMYECTNRADELGIAQWKAVDWITGELMEAARGMSQFEAHFARRDALRGVPQGDLSDGVVG